MKAKIYLIFLLVLIIGILVVLIIFKKSNSDDNQSILFQNEMNIVDEMLYNKEDIALLELCKVWGVLKYHQPNYKDSYKIDSLLIKEYQNIVDNKIDINKIISQNIKIQNNNDTYIGDIPDKNWINNSNIINKQSKKNLINFILDSYNSTSKSRIVSIDRDNELDFERDSLFHKTSYTSKGMRFLALCKIWNIVRYYYPYFQDISNDWNNVFLESLPQFINAKNEIEYYSAILKLSSKIKDSHIAVKSFTQDEFENKYVGNIIFKTLENRTFVKNYITNSLNSNLKIGDEIISIDDLKITSIRDSIKQYISGSNEIIINRDIDKKLLISNKRTLKINIIRQGKHIEIIENLTSIEKARATEESQHKSYASKSVSKVIDDNIGYINIKNIFSGNFRISFEKIENSKAIIFDLRSYPNEIGFDFLKYFDTTPFKFMNLYRADASYPGLIRTIDSKFSVPKSNSSCYSKPVVILINEFTQSQAESTVLAMSSIKNSVTLGDATAGTNGNVTILSLPGMMKIRFSGLGVLTSNNQITQRIGIVPDVVVKEDINTLKTGKDIQLEEAINYLRNKI